MYNHSETAKKFGFGKWMKGRHLSKETRLKQSLALRGDKGYWWKGDAVGYYSMHKRIIKTLGKAKECSYCGGEKNIQWASISHKALRTLDDYIPLCASCHKIYDGGSSKIPRDKLGRFMHV